jgi:hypothetical protein
MHTSGLLLLLLVPITAALKTETFQAPPKHSKFTAELTSINETLIGERQFNYYMYGSLRNGYSTEKITAETLDGKPVYKVETHDIFRFPAMHFEESNTVLLKTDLSIISRRGTLIQNDKQSGKKTLIEVSCRGQTQDRMTCDYKTDGGPTESEEFKTPNGEPITFEQTLARAIPWDKNPILDEYSVSDHDRQLKRYVVSQKGTRSVNFKNGQTGIVREIHFQAADKSMVNSIMWLHDEQGHLGGEIFMESAAGVKVLRSDLPQPELPSRPDPATTPLEQLSPIQSMSAFAIASIEKDTGRYLQLFDDKCIYDYFVSELPEQDMISYEQFSKEFRDNLPEMGNDEWRTHLLEQFPDYPLHTIIDTIMHNTFEASVQGNSATLTDKSDGSTQQLYRYDGVWKICILDDLFDETDFEDSEDQE